MTTSFRGQKRQRREPEYPLLGGGGWHTAMGQSKPDCWTRKLVGKSLLLLAVAPPQQSETANRPNDVVTSGHHCADLPRTHVLARLACNDSLISPNTIVALSAKYQPLLHRGEQDCISLTRSLDRRGLDNRPVAPAAPGSHSDMSATPAFSMGVVPDNIWIFGYGSLIWKHADVPHTESKLCFVRGYKRRFWQGSTDHRGTVAAPGRVVSLYTPSDFEKMGAAQKDRVELGEHYAEPWQVYGMAFKVTKEHRDKVIESLTIREVDGYQPVWLPLYTDEGPKLPAKVCVEKALTYVAPCTNPRFLGFATHRQIAAHVSETSGNSGPNIDYIRNLRDALVQLGHPDHHVSSIVDIALSAV